MTATRDYAYSTERLLVNEWHSFSPDQWLQPDLADVVQDILTERATQSLPPSWQGTYTLSRAQRWITERDEEGVTLLAINKASKHVIGMVILFASEGGGDLRLGYILNESAWGQGFASELVAGFVEWCRQHEIQSITGGVERDNIASRRVLKKCGFVADADTVDSGEQLFSIRLI